MVNSAPSVPDDKAKHTTSTKPVVLLNPRSNYGKGGKLWEKVRGALRARIGEYDVITATATEELGLSLAGALKAGANKFMAAGGDGTVNLLLNLLLNLTGRTDIVIGAVGLGSSNDFHKPFRKEAFIGNVPAKVDFEHAISCDVIQVKYLDKSGSQQVRYSLINSSIGLTAEANAFFNRRLPIVRILQRMSVDAAIFFTAVRTILKYHNLPCVIVDEWGHMMKINLTNLGVIKNPHFTGSLCYDTAILPDDGKLGINLCAELTKFERLRLMVALTNHRFNGLPKTKCWLGNRLAVRSGKPFAVEVDGEISVASDLEFVVLPKRARCCR
jgi:diacylglycerol kinase (ATP)